MLNELRNSNVKTNTQLKDEQKKIKKVLENADIRYVDTRSDMKSSGKVPS